VLMMVIFNQDGLGDPEEGVSWRDKAKYATLAAEISSVSLSEWLCQAGWLIV
jgi:hypothetical protein